VAGTADPNPRTGGAGIRDLRENGIQVEIADDPRAGAIIEPFARAIRSERPYVGLKMAASLDVITGGRVELTLGAGGQEGHFRAYGIEIGTAGERFRRLRELLKSSDVVSLHVPLNNSTRHMIGADELARLYPGHIETRPSWMLSLAGGVMGIMTVLHGSLSEYVLIFGTPVGSEGFSGRYRIEIHDFMLAGEMWTYTESDFAARRVYRAGDAAFLQRREAKGVRIFEGAWMPEYGPGTVPTVLPFALSGAIAVAGAPPGAGSVVGKFIAVTPGTAGNLPVGTVLTWQSPPSGADSTVTLTSPLRGASILDLKPLLS